MKIKCLTHKFQEFGFEMGKEYEIFGIYNKNDLKHLLLSNGIDNPNMGRIFYDQDLLDYFWINQKQIDNIRNKILTFQ